MEQTKYLVHLGIGALLLYRLKSRWLNKVMPVGDLVFGIVGTLDCKRIINFVAFLSINR